MLFIRGFQEELSPFVTKCTSVLWIYIFSFYKTSYLFFLVFDVVYCDSLDAISPSSVINMLITQSLKMPKGVTSSRKSKDRQHNGKSTKNKRTYNDLQIRVITKLPNSEQSYKGKVKTHKFIDRQNQSTTGKL